ncbi:hypothetical protein ACFQX6_52485 [Streptosporangium lutulentum]
MVPQMNGRVLTDRPFHSVRPMVGEYPSGFEGKGSEAKAVGGKTHSSTAQSLLVRELQLYTRFSHA